jgi:hypothetical protein
MSNYCEDCGTKLRGGLCGNCNEVETNDYIDTQIEINRVDAESYPDWTQD